MTTKCFVPSCGLRSQTQGKSSPISPVLPGPLSSQPTQPPPGPVPFPDQGLELLQEPSITDRGWLKSHLIGPHPGPSESGSPSCLRFGHSLNQNLQSKRWWKVQSFLPCLGFAQGWTSNTAVPHTVRPHPLLCKIRKQIGICNRYEQDDGNSESKMPPVPRSYPTPCHVCKELRTPTLCVWLNPTGW